MSQTTQIPKNFQDAYQVLKKNADYLEQSEQLDIDNLVTIVEESLSAYRICQSRIDAVEQALQSAFAKAEADKTTPTQDA